ncbi:FAD-binding oxidoreductase [Arthrobacter sp. SDTb3-6]|nr:FAD-binding oxidoreductase [Arthrobacter sp. SDTb3-6]
MEATNTVVIGSGFSGLAMAAELNRQGIKAIVVDCPAPPASQGSPATGGVSLDAMDRRTEIMRLLEHYARRHELDIRPATAALHIESKATPAGRLWEIRTATGILTAHSIVFTRGALNQLRRMLHGVGIGTGQGLGSAMQALGLYLVGVGELLTPSTQEILHQAKHAGQCISARAASRQAGTLPGLA